MNIRRQRFALIIIGAITIASLCVLPLVSVPFEAEAAPMYDLEDTATISVSSTYSGYSSADAIDDDTVTEWKSNDTGSNGWIRFNWASDVTIREIRLSRKSSGGYSGWGYPRFTFADGTYIMGCYVVGTPTVTYRLNTPVTTSSLKISIELADSAVQTGLAEVEINDDFTATATPTPGGGSTNLACADQIDVSGIYPDVTPYHQFRAIDGNTSTAWASNNDGANSWIEFIWRQPVTISQIKLQRHTTPWGVPRFTFSDGSFVDVGGDPSDSSLTTYDITPKATFTLRISIASGGSGSGRGFKEIQVFGDPGGYVAVTSAQNYLQDGSFETYPFLEPLGLSPWQSSWFSGTVTRMTFATGDGYSSTEPVMPICGQAFQELDALPGQIPIPGIFDHTGTYTEQEIEWVGGNMYISLGARTSDANTHGILQILNPNGTVSVLDADIFNTGNSWEMFHYQYSAPEAGTYKVQLKTRTSSTTTTGHMAVDAMSVHEGYWTNDCNLIANLWNRDQTPLQYVVTATAQVAATATPNYPAMTSAAGTRVAVANSTAAAAGTSTQVAGITSTARANATATRQAQIFATQTQGAIQTQTQIANLSGLTATRASTNASATAQYIRTATAFVSGFRATQTAQAAAALTQAAANQQQAQSVQLTIQAIQTSAAMRATQTAAANQTQAALAPIYAQLTAAAQQNATNAAILTQQAQAQLTAIAQATATANATTEAQLTQLAQVQATIQALATLQATQQVSVQVTVVGQGQQDTTLPPLTAYQWDEGCSRPTNTLNIPAWIDYSICRLMSWFSWNQQNTEQVTILIDLANTREPFATIRAVIAMLQETAGLFGTIDCATGRRSSEWESNTRRG